MHNSCLLSQHNHIRARFIATPSRSTHPAARLFDGRGEGRSSACTVCDTAGRHRRLLAGGSTSPSSSTGRFGNRTSGRTGTAGDVNTTVRGRCSSEQMSGSSSGQRLRPTGTMSQHPPQQTAESRTSRDCSLRRRQHSWCTRHPRGHTVRASPARAMAPRHSEQVWARLGLSMLDRFAKTKRLSQRLMKEHVCYWLQ